MTSTTNSLPALQLQIDRARWVRGEGNSRLLQGDGRMCCLGFLALECGFTPEQIFRKPSIAAAANDNELFESVLGHPVLKHLLLADTHPVGLMSSKLGFEMMGVNDEEISSRIEEKLTLLFAKCGVAVEFVN